MPWRKVLSDSADEVYQLITAIVPTTEGRRLQIFDHVVRVFRELGYNAGSDCVALRKRLLCVAAGCALTEAESLELRVHRLALSEPLTIPWPDFDAGEITILTYWMIKEPVYRAAHCLNDALEEKYVLRCLLRPPSTEALDALLSRARKQARGWKELLDKPARSVFATPLYCAVSGLTGGMHAKPEPMDVMASLEWQRENI